ncbi:MAG: hypothetical protein FJ313_05875 [Gemmatimonadetes bacterium]|nr:hypothetical protein [Gemmatimonadota bacterium]
MRTPSGRWLAAVAGVVVILVAAGVAVAVINPPGASETFSEDTPEGVVQRFVVALQERDYGLAHGYLSDELKKTCTVAHVEETGPWTAERFEDVRVVLLGKEELSGGRTQLRVRVTEVNVAPPFGVNEFTHRERYVLVQEDGEWRFVEPPWPIGWCPALTPPEKGG